MNIIDKLMKIDAGTLETPTAIHKMYVKKIGEELEFEIQAINAEKATEIQQKAIKIEDGNVSDIDVYKTKVLTIMEGCPIFKDKALREHFDCATPKELILVLMDITLHFYRPKSNHCNHTYTAILKIYNLQKIYQKNI